MSAVDGVPIAMIAAVARNGVIGAGNQMPWHLPSDFSFFKATTMGKPLVMGRRTFESIGRPLPGRTNIVVSARAGYQPDGVIVIRTLEAALLHAQAIAVADDADAVMIGGGGTLYAACMPIAKRLYITHVALDPQGDTLFPRIDPDLWMPVAHPDVAPSPRDTASFRVTVYAPK